MTNSSTRITRRILSMAAVLICLHYVALPKYVSAQGLPPQLVPPPVPVENPITESKRVLGKILFWDEQLSSDNTVACGTCHKPEQGGADARLGLSPGANGIFGTGDDVMGSPGVIRLDQSLNYEPDAVFGLRVQVTGRLSQDNLMSAYGRQLFWDGRALEQFIDPETGLVAAGSKAGLESQAVGPILSMVEMAHVGRTWSEVTSKLAQADPLRLATNIPADMAQALTSSPTYPDLFQAAFGTPQISAKRIAFAIATYQRTLIPDQTPYDLYAAGQSSALTSQQIIGLDFYRNQGRCDVCHKLPTTSDNLFHNLALRPDSEDEGLQRTTGLIADRGKFKTPSLRNLSLRSRFFHNGQADSMADIASIYLQGGGGNSNNRSPLLLPVPITPTSAVFNFINNGLLDPRVAAGSFPFDRPTLWSERNISNGNLFGLDTAGSGGQRPKMLAQNAAFLGNPQFRLGIAGALGGATAVLGISASTPSPPLQSFGAYVWLDMNNGFWVTKTLSGVGTGQGYDTWSISLPDVPFLMGVPFYAQWGVIDPGSSGGLAATKPASFTLF